MLVVGLIPARGGSVRVRHKNRKPLAGTPLVVWSIEAAQQSGVCSEIVVSTDDDEIAAVASAAGATVDLRASVLAADDAPDIGWVRAALVSRPVDCFLILRPTSPFRTAETIQRAWSWFVDQQPCDSLRAVEPARQHPGKMWYRRIAYLPDRAADGGPIGSAVIRERLLPVLPLTRPWAPSPSQAAIEVPWHSSPTQTLPQVYVQNASLEIAWRHVALPPSLTVAGTHAEGTIAGEIVCPFFTIGWEGFDINTPEDWATAEAYAETVRGRASCVR